MNRERKLRSLLNEAIGLIDGSRNKGCGRIDSYTDACNYLERSDYELVGIFTFSKHYKRLNAMLKLLTIAEAWNRQDGFVPDYSDNNQYKYFPWFAYDGASAGFACASAVSAAPNTYTNIGSRLCFKTRERAEQFGKQFIDLWNDFLQ
jgi:hypothetical protein